MALSPSTKPDLWYRKIELTINTPTGDLIMDYENLDIYFRVSRTDNMDADKCDIEIYDLSESTKSKINQLCTLVLRAGYRDGRYGIIYKGSVSSVNSVEGGTDVCTYVRSTDQSRAAIDGFNRNLYYKKGTKFVDIIKNEIKDWNTAIKEDPKYAPLYDHREITEGTIEDPDDYYKDTILKGLFKLNKDERKTQTLYGTLKDMVDRTNGIIWANIQSTPTEREYTKKGDFSLINDKNENVPRKSWTFYLKEEGDLITAHYYHMDYAKDNKYDIVLDAASGLLDITPVDTINRAQGWTGKCLLNPDIVIGSMITCIPSQKKVGFQEGGAASKERPYVQLIIRELVHEQADGGVFYTTFKGMEPSATLEIVS